MGKSIFHLCILFSLLLLSSTISARKDVGEYWRGVMKDQPLPQVLQRLIPDQVSVVNAQKTNCRDSDQKKKMNVFEEFEERISIYDNNVKPTTKEKPGISIYDKPTLKEGFAKEFDEEPNAFIWDSSVQPTQKKSFTKEFDEEPNAFIWDSSVQPTQKKSFTKEFDEEANISVYENGMKPTQKEKFAKEFGREADFYLYDNVIKPKQKEKFTKEFEPKANILV